MKKSNVIAILIDSVNSDYSDINYTGVDSTPFIDMLKKDSFFANNIYSYGPYTDAASKSLYCFNKTLDDYGYYFGINESKRNHFKTFKINGYETFGYWYPYYLVGNKIRKYVDHIRYTSGFEYKSIWFGKLEYYANKKDSLTKTEQLLLIKCIDLMFDCWISFYENLYRKRKTKNIIENFDNKRINGSGYNSLLKEFEKYRENKIKYIKQMLDKGLDHPLSNINDYQYGKNENIAFVKSIFKKYKVFFNKANQKNILVGLKNIIIDKRNLYENLINKPKKRYLMNILLSIFYGFFIKRRYKKNGWRNVPSFGMQISFAIDDLKNRNNEDKPFYLSMHIEEAHHNFCFFSYDCYDLDQIEKELDYLKPIIESNDFNGNIYYLLSLRYIDFCVKKLFDELNNNDLLKNTTVMLMADHGTSFYFDPIRTSVVNNFYKENYKVPLLIYNKRFINNGIICKDMFSSDNIYATLFDIIGINSEFSNKKSILRYKKVNKYIITEYMGPGVPDMIEKEVWISIRSNKYSISYINKINMPLDIDNPVSIFDLEYDPKELNNIKTIRNREINFLIKKLENRYHKIQSNSKNYLNKINKKMV